MKDRKNPIQKTIILDIMIRDTHSFTWNKFGFKEPLMPNNPYNKLKLGCLLLDPHLCPYTYPSEITKKSNLVKKRDAEGRELERWWRTSVNSSLVHNSGIFLVVQAVAALSTEDPGDVSQQGKCII